MPDPDNRPDLEGVIADLLALHAVAIFVLGLFLLAFGFAAA